MNSYPRWVVLPPIEFRRFVPLKNHFFTGDICIQVDPSTYTMHSESLCMVVDTGQLGPEEFEEADRYLHTHGYASVIQPQDFFGFVRLNAPTASAEDLARALNWYIHHSAWPPEMLRR